MHFPSKNLALEGADMYIKNRKRQINFTDFNQPMGLHMNPENRWIKKAETIPWDDIENEYAKLFSDELGAPAKPVHAALGSLLIQKQYGYSDRELVEQITENPYYQYFIGLEGYQEEKPFAPSLLVEFRKRLDEDVLMEINEMILAFNDPDDPPPSSGGGDDGSDELDNDGTLILDATCAPQNISFPQDINLLNTAREKCEMIIDTICYEYNIEKPRTYRRKARQDYLLLARSKKRTKKKIRKAIKKQLQYIRRDLKYIEAFLSIGLEIRDKHMELLLTIYKVFEQQEYMYKNDVRSVPNRIVSISQPYIRPIVRGKAKSPTEFGAKLDMSLDSNGYARIEKLSFDAYNECDVLQDAIERYRKRTGRYPERVLADKIYRNRLNLQYCRDHGIRLLGPPLGRPKKNENIDKKQEYIDNADRVAVERAFSLSKRCYGLGLIKTKLENTTKSSIVLSIIAMNVGWIVASSLRQFLKLAFSRSKSALMRRQMTAGTLLVVF